MKKYTNIAPRKEVKLKKKTTFSGPSPPYSFSSIKGGVNSDYIKMTAYRDNTHVDKAESLLVSVVYSQLIGPLVFA